MRVGIRDSSISMDGHGCETFVLGGVSDQQLYPSQTALQYTSSAVHKYGDSLAVHFIDKKLNSLQHLVRTTPAKSQD